MKNEVDKTSSLFILVVSGFKKANFKLERDYECVCVKVGATAPETLYKKKEVYFSDCFNLNFTFVLLLREW